MTEAGWTRKKPTAAGWYWWRSQERSYEEVLMVLGDEKLGCPLFAMQDGEERALSRLGGEWLGPITPDSYQHGRVAGARECVEKVRARAALWRAHGGAKIGFPYGHLTVEGECDSIADELGKLAQRAQEGKEVGDGK